MPLNEYRETGSAMGRATTPVALAAIACLLAGCLSSRARIKHPPNLAGANRNIVFDIDVSTYETTNGLELIVLPDNKTNLVKVDMRYRVGAAEDPQGKAGLAHLVEHLSFQVQLAGDDGPTLAEYLSDKAIYFNAYTNWDATHYTSIGMVEDLASLLTVESRRMSAGCDAIDLDLLAREREVVRNEIRSRSGPDARSFAFLHDAVYGPKHVYHRPIAGSDVEVAGITAEDACGFIDGHYGPSRAILVVSGNVKAHEVANIVGKRFGRIDKPASASRRMVGAVNLSGSERRHKLDIEEATALIAFEGAPIGTSESMYQRLLITVLNRRFFELRQKHKYISKIDVGIGGGARAPLFLIAISVDKPGRLRTAVNDLFDDLKTFQNETFENNYFIALRERIRTEFVFTVEPFMRESMVYADYAQYADHDQFVLRDLEFFENALPAGLMMQAKRLLRRSGSHITYLYPDPEATATETRASLAFSPTDYDIQEWTMPVDPARANQTPVVPQRKQLERMRAFRLINGLDVLLVPSLEYPVVDIRLMFRAGSLHDPPDKPGLAELAMNLLEFNLPQVNDLRDFLAVEQMRVIFMMGGDMGQYMDGRTTTFRITGMSAYADGLLWWLHWVLENGIYTNESIERMRELVARDNDDDDDDGERGKKHMRAVLGILYGAEHPYARLGDTERTLAKISRADLEDFRDRHYRMQGATMIVTGRFDADVVESEIRRLFAWGVGDPAPPVPAVPTAAVRSETQYLASFDEDTSQTGVLMAFDTQPGFAEHQAARLVLREMVDEKVSSLRLRLGATYGVSVRHASRIGPGMLLISASLDSERASESFQELRKSLDELRAGDNAEAFVRARRRALRKILADSFHSKSVADELELVATYKLPREYYKKLAREVAALRPADMQALIARELAPEHQVVLVHGQRERVLALFQEAGIKSVHAIK